MRMLRWPVAAVVLSTVSMLLGQTAPSPVVQPVFPTGLSTPLGAQIAALLADPGVFRAHWGIAVTALDGTPIYGYDEGQMFRPASTAKLFTTTAAMALLGPESRLGTTIEMLTDVRTHVVVLADPEHTKADPSVFQGFISINGDGDAYLSDRAVPYVTPGKAQSSAAKTNPLQFFEDAASVIAATGVRTVKGEISGNDRAFRGDPLGETWSREDTAWGYGAPVTALVVNDNQLRLTLTPGRDIFAVGDADVHATAALYPATSFYTMEVDVTTVSNQAAHIWVDHPDGPRSLHVYGHIPPGAPYVTDIAIDDPALFAAVVLKDALERHGVKVDAKLTRVENPEPSNDAGPDLPANAAMQASEQTTQEQEEEQTKQMCQSVDPLCKIVGEHVSPTLADDVVVTLKTSQNLHAEIILRRMAYRYGADPTASDGAWAVRQWLLKKGIDGGDFVFYDGSGLSAKDLVTPRATAQLLAYAATQPWFPQWKSALPIGGVDGTLSSRFMAAPLKGHVFAKTGTLGESRALAGYLDAASGRQVIFSIFVDNHTPGSSADRVVMDKIVAAIAAAN